MYVVLLISKSDVNYKLIGIYNTYFPISVPETTLQAQNNSVHPRSMLN